MTMTIPSFSNMYSLTDDALCALNLKLLAKHLEGIHQSRGDFHTNSDRDLYGNTSRLLSSPFCRSRASGPLNHNYFPFLRLFTTLF